MLVNVPSREPTIPKQVAGSDPESATPGFRYFRYTRKLNKFWQRFVAESIYSFMGIDASFRFWIRLPLTNLIHHLVPLRGCFASTPLRRPTCDFLPLHFFGKFRRAKILRPDLAAKSARFLRASGPAAFHSCHQWHLASAPSK